MDKYLSTKTITLAGTMRRINLPPMRCITPPPMVEARLTSPLSPPSFSLWLILAPAAVFYYSHPVITLAQMPAPTYHRHHQIQYPAHGWCVEILVELVGYVLVLVQNTPEFWCKIYQSSGESIVGANAISGALTAGARCNRGYRRAANHSPCPSPPPPCHSCLQ